MLFVVREDCPANVGLQAHLGDLVQFCNVKVGKFADGESTVRIDDIPRELLDRTYLFYHLYPDVNNRLAELLFIADGLKRMGVRHVSAIIPYFCYSRQDRLTPNASSLSAKVVCDLLWAVGVKEIISCDLHSGCVAGFFRGRFVDLSTNVLFFYHALASGLEDYVLVAPDLGSRKRCEIFLRDADRFLGAKDFFAARAIPESSIRSRWRDFPSSLDWLLATIDKERDPGTGRIVAGAIHGASVKGKNCIIVDDILASGYTLCMAADLLKNAGAKSVTAYVTHAVLSAGAVDNIEKSRLDKVYVTDTIAETTSGLAKVLFREVGEWTKLELSTNRVAKGGRAASSKMAVLPAIEAIRDFLVQ